ncbi:ribosomal protein S18-alanine N-acetyltransferase [Candidatus Parcubacteria bacterium]|nr:ribosomal protein S18-alanine N-acetyltransferase [Patescibacteria group bacterium]MCG2688728.1 ribosomal protein S18-alanine N-acetyltransferase [Candidatus Parcubacteria bacterium]
MKNKATVKLRKFKPGDLDQILKIEKACFSKTDAYSKRKFKLLFKARHNFIVAEKANEITGYMIAKVKKNLLDFVSIAISKRHQGLGIGIILMKFIINYSKACGIKKASLEVKTTNKKAISFYENIGFKIKKTVKKYYRDGKSAYLMEKSL